MSSTNISDGFLFLPREQSLRQRFISSIGQPLAVGDLPHHVFMYREKGKTNIYRAFCSGSIIHPLKVMTSAHCFLSNQKKFSKKLKKVHVVAGSLTVYTKREQGSHQQWRNIKKIHSQRYYRFPAYSLAVVVIDEPWQYNALVNFIPYASVNADYDGVCYAASARTTTAWSTTRVLFRDQLHIIKQSECEVILQRNCRIYYCTAYGSESSLASTETEGAGLVCFGTGDPEEKDNGLLVGVTTLVNIQLPSLHNRIGIFRKWVNDSATVSFNRQKNLILLILIFIIHIGRGDL